jgi:hypothetical protein
MKMKIAHYHHSQIMTLIDQLNRVTRWTGLVWRPRGATCHEIRKKSKHDKYRLLRNNKNVTLSHQHIFFKFMIETDEKVALILMQIERIVWGLTRGLGLAGSRRESCPTLTKFASRTQAIKLARERIERREFLRDAGVTA